MHFKFINILILVLAFFTLEVPGAQKQKVIKLHIGSVKTLEIGKVIRVAVGVEQLLTTSILDNGDLLLIPKQAGETDLKIWKAGERVVNLRIIITTANTISYIDDIRNVISDFDKVTVRSVNGLMILEGEVTPQRFELFKQITSGFTGVINKVMPTALVMKDMINFQVQVLEVNKNYAKNVGIAWDRSTGGPSVGFVQNFVSNGTFAVTSEDAITEGLFDSENPIIGFDNESAFSFLGIASSLTSRINLLKEDGAARILAEPQLSTRNGEVASFHSGGSYPLAVLNEFGQPVVQMQDYGIRLNIEPMSDENNNIVSTISAEMSSLDFSTVVNGVPGLLTRKTESVVNLRSGETLIISGLVQTTDSKAVEKVPLLGDIPILGELFKSKNFNENKTELIILVTPTIVTPNKALPKHMQDHLESIQKVLGQSKIEDELLL